MNTRSSILATMLLAAAGAAFAQATITQDKALAGDVTPGDASGFPIKITQPGHYRLMGNLVVPTGQTGIEVAANDVTIDLNGFRMVGPGGCTWNQSTMETYCQNYGLKSLGINVAPGFQNLAVRNGTLRGFQYAVIMEAGRVEDVQFMHNWTGLLQSGHATSFVAARLAFDHNHHAAVTACGALLHTASVSRNFYGVSGCGTVLESHVSANRFGLDGILRYRGVRFMANKFDASSGASLF